MSTLVIANRLPCSAAHGYDLRVYALSQYIGGPRHLLVVPLNSRAAEGQGLCLDAVFTTVETVDSTAESPSFRRHLRVSNAHFLPLAFPRSFSAAAARIREIIGQRRIERIVAFGANLASLAKAAAFPHVLLDVCDSPSLTAARSHLHDRFTRGVGQRVQASLYLWRWRRCEAALPDWFSQITTINAADSEEIARLNGKARANIHTVPNGVGEHFLHTSTVKPAARGVAFWGNLGFPPNREAVRYFIESVYQPYLRDSGIEVAIVGKGAEPWLLDAAIRNPRIKLLGFAEDLVRTISEYPVMINPMVIGSGLKNKVLEAYAMGLAVVSTPLGVEAFPDAVHNEHHLTATTPLEFAHAVLNLMDDGRLRDRLRANARTLVEANYRWEVIGSRWNGLVESL